LLRLIVFGGRQYTDKAHVFATLDRIHAKKTINLVIENGDSGVAGFAWEWAVQRHVQTCTINANQERNAADLAEQQCSEMVLEGRPTGCVVFPGGKKTASMAKVAIERNLVIMEVKPTNIAQRPATENRHSSEIRTPQTAG
jgi:hypothetical protein